MECTSCPGKDRKLLVIVVVGVLFLLEKMKSTCLIALRRLGCVDLFFEIPFWENFGRFLIVADAFRDMLINSVLQS